MKGATAITIFALLAATIACAPSQPGSDVRLTPEEVISRSQNAMNKVQSYRVMSESTSTDEHGTTESGGMFEIVAPDRVHALPLVNLDKARELIAIGGAEYTRAVDGGAWQVQERPRAASPIVNTATALTGRLSSLVELKRLPDEKVDGVDSYHYTGIVDTKAQLEEMRARLERLKAELDPSLPELVRKAQVDSAEASVKAFENMQYAYEFWIGKGDFLLRQLKTRMEVSYTINEGEGDEKEEFRSEVNTFRFYDFNAPIRIEPPIVDQVERVNLTASMSNTGNGGTDPERFQANYRIYVHNQGIATASNVKIFVDTTATNEGFQTFEAEPEKTPAHLAPGESTYYTVGWEYDLVGSGKERFMEQERQTVIRATWEDETGQQYEKIIRQGG